MGVPRATWGDDDLPYDYEGALDMARKLWQTADALEASARQRFSAAATAVNLWRGPLRDPFVARGYAEVKDLNEGAQKLREAARGWAQNWKEVIDENNRRRRARRTP